MPQDLNGRTVLLTGASSGIGRHTALAMAGAGANLVLVARRAEALCEVAEAVEARGAAVVTCRGDVAQPDTMPRAVRACLDRFGRLDVLVNNAGEGFFASIDDTTEEDLDRMLAVNLMGTFRGIKAALPVMRRQGAGHIINMASTAGKRGSPYVGAYCASKFAVVGLTESLRAELLSSGIAVSLVCPGVTRTAFFDVAQRRTSHHRGPGPRAESPEGVAAWVVDLVRRPRPEFLPQPVGRKLFLMMNVLAPGYVDRKLARQYQGRPDGEPRGGRASA